MGAKVELFSNLSLALPDEMYIPKKDDYLNLSLTTTQAFRDFGFEPYKKGVIAFSKSITNISGRQVVYQITTFCQDKIPKILLSALPGSNEYPDWYLENINSEKPSFKLRIDGEKYNIPRVQLASAT